MLRIGVIGAGVVAARHADAYRRHPRCALVAVTEPIAARGQAFAGRYGATWYADYRDMLSKGHLDAVSVCLPHHLHHPVALAAAEAGLHMLMEKPISLTVAEADEMIAACRRFEVRMMLGFVHRFRGEVLEADRLIAAGAIGRPATAQDSICTLGGSHPPAWVWEQTQAGGGVLMYGGIHSVDRLLWLLRSDVVEVFAYQTRYASPGNVENGLTAVLRFANGAIATLFENSPPYGKPGGWLTEIYGTEGAIRIKTGEWLELTTAEQSSTQNFTRYDHFQREINEFVASLLEDRVPSVTAEDGRRALAVARAIYDSAASGQPRSVEGS